jgi:predicted membrane chloride channel (bestrophin family)
MKEKARPHKKKPPRRKLRQIGHILVIFNLKTVIVTLFSVASTYLCHRFGFIADFPLTLIATAVVFPIVFAINGAYKRRENALMEYGNIKAHGRALLFAARDWLPEQHKDVQVRIKTLLGQLLTACRGLFAGTIAQMSPGEEEVYRLFSRLSEFIRENYRGGGLASGEVSRCNQYLSKMLISFENLKHIFQYRTPRTLNAFSGIFITILPVIYGPYFASLAVEISPVLLYVTPILFSIILVSLDNIQQHLENPFDQIGEDDIVINAEKFVKRLDLR